MTDNETKLCKAYAKTMGKTFKAMKADFEQAVLKEAMAYYTKKNIDAYALASSLSEDEIGDEQTIFMV